MVMVEDENIISVDGSGRSQRSANFLSLAHRYTLQTQQRLGRGSGFRRVGGVVNVGHSLRYTLR